MRLYRPESSSLQERISRLADDAELLRRRVAGSARSEAYAARLAELGAVVTI